MRTILALVVLLVLVPRQSLASALLFMEFLNSDLTFGLVNPDQLGYDLSSFGVTTGGTYRPLAFDAGTAYQALGGPFVQQTIVEDGGGAVVGSKYLYRGGTFEIAFAVEHDGAVTRGWFVAPIISLEIDAGQGPEQSADASYLLGPGLFEASIAHALGLPRRTRGGTVYSGLILTDDGNRGGIAGDHTTPERHAWDGYADVEIAVPEPSIAILAVLGLGTAWLRVFRHRRLAGPRRKH